MRPKQPSEALQQTYQNVHFEASERAGVDVLPEGQEPEPGDIRDSIWTNFLMADPHTGRRLDSCTCAAACSSEARWSSAFLCCLSGVRVLLTWWRSIS